MSFKIYDLEMDGTGAHQQLLNVVTSLNEIESDFLCDSVNGFDTYETWAEQDPDSYMDFINFCVEHPDENARKFICTRADFLFKSQTAFTIGIYNRLLRDESDSVKFSAAENIEHVISDIASSEEDMIVEAIGFKALGEFLMTLSAVIKIKKTK